MVILLAHLCWNYLFWLSVCLIKETAVAKSNIILFLREKAQTDYQDCQSLLTADLPNDMSQDEQLVSIKTELQWRLYCVSAHIPTIKSELIFATLDAANIWERSLFQRGFNLFN